MSAPTQPSPATPPTLKELLAKCTPGPYTLELGRGHPDAPLAGYGIKAPGKIPFLASANMGCGQNHAHVIRDEDIARGITTGYSAVEMEANAQLIARCSPETISTIYAAMDFARCVIHNTLEAERTSEAPITEQCQVLIMARKKLIEAQNLLDGQNGG